MALDRGGLVVREGEPVQRRDVVLELGHARRADERGGDALVTEHPCERHLRERLAASRGDLVQRAELSERLVREQLGRERARPARARALRNPGQVLAREHSLRERREGDAPDPELTDRVEQVGLDPAVEHRVRGLVDEEWRPELAEYSGRFTRLLSRVRGDARVQRLAGPDRRVERAHRLLEWRLRVEAVGVEDVDVLETHPREALIEAREEVLARTPLAVRARPHVVARLRRDDELVTEGPEILVHEHAEVLLR